MLFDLKCTPEQLKAAAGWIEEGDTMGDVEMLVDDRMLIVSQGDDRNAFDTGGEPASSEYLAVAPLDRPQAPTFASLRERVQKEYDEASAYFEEHDVPGEWLDAEGSWKDWESEAEGAAAEAKRDALGAVLAMFDEVS